MSKKRVLVVGGTGYLGQHLLQGFSDVSGSPYHVAFTHHSSPIPLALRGAFPDFPAFCVDLKSGGGLDFIAKEFGQPHVVVNCAAMSLPRACEKDPDGAMAINVPSSLVNWLSSFSGNANLLIHLSTDQVYEGLKCFYKEEDEANPVNVYGKSKVAAEQFISEKCPNFAILRSSIIYGPQTVSPVPKSLPIQWIDNVLSRGDQVSFFHDEFRCPVYVKDLVAIILTLSEKWMSEDTPMKLLLNAGGPDRVSRVQMAEVVAEFRGYNTSLVKSVPASSVSRGVVSPADISMDISKLVQTVGFHLMPFREGVSQTLSAETR